MNNHSIYSADRSTHLKIVVMALVAGIGLASFAIATRSTDTTTTAQAVRVIKADKPVVMTNSGASVIR